MKTRTRIITQAAMIAALYVVLTVMANLLGLASGVIQIRFSEALCVLPYFTAAAVPGLFIGCVLSNFITGSLLPDVIFGGLATLLGAILTRKLRFQKWLAPIGPIISNTLIVPLVLRYAYGLKPLWFSFITVGIGEILSCGVLGMILLFSLKKYSNKIFMEEQIK